MKFACFLILAAISTLLANGHCEKMHREFMLHIPNQITTTCRVSGIEDGRTDILGFFFKFSDDTQAVFVYGEDYPVMLYVDKDDPVKNAKCIENENFRAIQSPMTSEQIAAKLLSYKNCEPEYSERHPPTGSGYL